MLILDDCCAARLTDTGYLEKRLLALWNTKSGPADRDLTHVELVRKGQVHALPGLLSRCCDVELQPRKTECPDALLTSAESLDTMRTPENGIPVELVAARLGLRPKCWCCCGSSPEVGQALLWHSSEVSDEDDESSLHSIRSCCNIRLMSTLAACIMLWPAFRMH